MSGPGRHRPADPLKSAARRRRARRVAAFAGMLTTIAGLVGARAELAPPPGQAASSSSLATRVGSKGAAVGTASHRPASAGAASTRRVLVGKAYDVNYGIVQVKVTTSGNRITDITPMSLPQGGRSGDISRYAAPALRREALSAQSAHIDSVSGASYTSAGYAQSLQSALDQAGL